MTDWSVVDATGVARYRYNDRELHRAWADNAPKTRQFMMDNYVRFARIDGTHQGGGMTRAPGRARHHEARRQDRHQGRHDIAARTAAIPPRSGIRRSIRCASFPARRPTMLGAPGWVYGGFAIARSLEFSAREKGVQFMLNRHMDELIREHAVLGPGDGGQGQLHAAHESRNRRAAGKLLAATAISTSAPRRSTSGRARPSSSPPAACRAACRCGP